MNSKNYFLTVCLLLAACLSVLPQRVLAQAYPLDEAAAEVLKPERFIRNGSTISLGLITKCFDSYLSPNNYRGYELSFLDENWSRSAQSENLFLQFMSDTSLGLTVAGATSNMLLANEVLSEAWAWRVARLGIVDLYAGPELQGRIGIVYNSRNSNNPANAKLGVHAGAMGLAEVHYRILGKPVRTSFQLDMPLVGCVFSPQYTQPYYEIFTIGNEAGVLHFASPVNGFSLRRILTTDLTLRHSILRVVLEGDSYQWRTSTNGFALSSFRLGVGFVFNSYSIHPHEKASAYLPY